MLKKKLRKAPRDIPRWSNNFTWARELLGSTPGELRDDILRARDNHLSVLEFLLPELEEEARRTLKADPPSGMTADLKMSDLYRASIEPDTFLLNSKQENDGAILVHAFGLRNLLADFSNPHREISEKELGEEIALKAMQLALAAVRGDFNDSFLRPLKRFFEEVNKREADLSRVRGKGNEARRKGFDEMRQLCKKLDAQYRHLSPYRRMFAMEREIEKLGKKPPKKRTVRGWGYLRGRGSKQFRRSLGASGPRNGR